MGRGLSRVGPEAIRLGLRLRPRSGEGGLTTRGGTRRVSSGAFGSKLGFGLSGLRVHKLEVSC